jgi:hypothetical protein
MRGCLLKAAFYMDKCCFDGRLTIPQLLRSFLFPIFYLEKLKGLFLIFLKSWPHLVSQYILRTCSFALISMGLFSF